jgi:hypothetical protein
MSYSIGLLCFYNGIIINIDNGYYLQWRNNKFLTTSLDMSLTEVKRCICGRILLSLGEIKVNIT